MEMQWERPSEVFHFFRANWLERKLPFHLHNISTFAACAAKLKIVSHSILFFAGETTSSCIESKSKSFPLLVKRSTMSERSDGPTFILLASSGINVS